ncbi:hypothetical protein [Citreimonas sp.]|uniref:hypothetical protein n=1 Tax=Citreimonas sp. TaxID=3036715 RepID=UPI0035C83498
MNDFSIPAPATGRVLAGWVILLGLVATIAASGLVALRGDDAVAGAPVLVIAAPWGQGAAAIVTGAGGRPLGPVSAAFGTLATFDGAIPVADLRALGAWAVRDGTSIASICGVNLT